MKKILIIIAALLLISAFAGGATLAYLLAETPAVENNFVPVYVSCEVIEEFTGTTKSNVSVKNTGDIKAYIRATFVIMWTSEDGSVYSIPPKEGVDYSITLGSSSWSLGSDGFYYYELPVEAGASTDAIIDSLTILSTPPEGHNLNVHVAATAIQAEPAGAVEDAWGATVQENGALTAP